MHIARQTEAGQGTSWQDRADQSRAELTHGIVVPDSRGQGRTAKAFAGAVTFHKAKSRSSAAGNRKDDTVHSTTLQSHGIQYGIDDIRLLNLTAQACSFAFTPGYSSAAL